VARASRIIDRRFEVGRLLAEGGMSTVHEAHDRALDCAAVIKFLLPSLLEDADAIARFEREPRVLARLATASDGFVRALGAGVHHGRRYIVMERLEGETLQAMLDRRGPLPPAEVASILHAIARPIAAAHRLGVVHRDIKPDNLFLVTRDGELHIKVIDLGIAKQLDPAHACARTANLGTPLYMAPESMRDQPIGRDVDVWGLAAVGYQALTGRAPFSAETLLQLMQIVCWSDELPPPVATFVPGLSPAFDVFFARALTRDPARRYPSVEGLAAAFEEAARAGDP